jgi:hypothetical protein
LRQLPAKPSAQDVTDALGVPNDRDNSRNGVGGQGLGCVRLIATNTMSIYQRMTDGDDCERYEPRRGSLLSRVTDQDGPSQRLFGLRHLVVAAHTSTTCSSSLTTVATTW